MSTRKNLTGQQFGRWKVLEFAGTDSNRCCLWLCECQCKNKTRRVVSGVSLRTGRSRSCGCLSSEISRQVMHDSMKKYNKFDLSGEYGIGYDDKGNSFYFDLEDYNKIRNYYWYVGKRGYVYSTNPSTHRSFTLHRFVLGNDTPSTDHHNRIRTDCRKSNLIPCSQTDNCKNKSVSKNNTSGITGVQYDKARDKWVARLESDGVVRIRKRFDTKEEAIIARLKAEVKYFGKFAGHEELYEKYGITLNAREERKR